MVSLALTAGTVAGGLAFRRFAPGFGRAFARSGFRSLRSRQVIRAGAASTAVGVGASFATEGVVRGITSGVQALRRNGQVSTVPVRRFPQAPVRRGTIVTPGPVPVQFVKQWQACAALFAIDDQGHRWVWRPKLGIWKRIRNTRNIVISGKDLRRARRLVRISKRLNKMRTSLR